MYVLQFFLTTTFLTFFLQFILNDLKSKVFKKGNKVSLLGGWQGDRGDNQNIIIYRIIFKAIGKIKIFILMFSDHDSNQWFDNSVFSYSLGKKLLFEKNKL